MRRTTQGFEIIENSPTPRCPFCHEENHFGACAEMRAVQAQQTAELKPVVNPHVRHGRPVPNVRPGPRHD